MSNELISDIVVKLLQGSSTVAMAAGMWFGWKFFNLLKEVRDIFTKLVADVDLIKASHGEQLKETQRLREILESHGYELQTDAWRRVRRERLSRPR